jgi:arylsulfatase A-like enzyme
VCGEIAFAAILTGTLAAVPAALRVSSEGGSFLGAWIPLAGIAAAMATAVVFLLRAATIGIQKAIVDKSKRATALVAASLWILLSTLALSGFGTVLSAVTHHRGLGGATYAMVGVGIAAICALIAWRLAHLLGALARRPAVAWATFIAACLAIGAMLVVSVSRETATASAEPARAVADAALLAALAIGTSRIRLPNVHKRIWVPAAVLVLIGLVGLGISMLHRLASASPEAREHAQIVSPVLDLIAQPDARPKRRPPKRPASGTPAVAAASSSPAPAVDPEPATSAPQPNSPRVQRPDIVVITLDTLRADHLGTYGYERKTSPNLDALASKSAVFERAYAAGPETRTAIAPLFTCKHLVESVRDARTWPTLLRANETVAERLRAGGYATAAVSSFQWISKARGFDQGFDVFDEQPFKRVHPEKDITGAHAVAQAMAAYDQLSKDDKPLFLWVHMFDAHEAYKRHESFDFGNADKDRYDSEIAYMDAELSRLMDHVGKGPRSDKTVWIVHGSHGEAFGEHGFRGHPPKLFEEVVRVPLIVSLPWAKPQRVTDAVVSVLDVPVTVLSLALGDTGECSGKSLVELTEGKATQVSGRPMLLIAYDGLHGQAPAYGWLDDKVKFVLYAWKEGERTRLFDLRADPKEDKDLQSERPDQAILLRKQLDTHLKDGLRRIEEAPEP